MTQLSEKELRAKLATALGLQLGGIKGISKIAPANTHYYLRNEVINYDTEEVETVQFLNFESQLDQLLSLFKTTQQPIGDAIEIKVDPKVMQHVVRKIKLTPKNIAKRTLEPQWRVERWLNGDGDAYDCELYIWKLKILANLSGKYAWAVFLIDDVSKLTAPTSEGKSKS